MLHAIIESNSLFENPYNFTRTNYMNVIPSILNRFLLCLENAFYNMYFFFLNRNHIYS